MTVFIIVEIMKQRKCYYHSPKVYQKVYLYTKVYTKSTCLGWLEKQPIDKLVLEWLIE